MLVRCDVVAAERVVSVIRTVFGFLGVVRAVSLARIFFVVPQDFSAKKALHALLQCGILLPLHPPPRDAVGDDGPAHKRDCPV